MKKTVNILLAIAVVLPVVLLFLPFAQWNDITALILQVIPSLAAQILLCRIGKQNVVKAIPALLTGVFAVWGTYLYCTSPHWKNATLWGDLVADYVSPFICCVIVLAICLVSKKKQANCN